MTYDWHQQTGTAGMQVMHEWLGEHDERHIARLAEHWREMHRDLSRETHELHHALRELRHRWTGPAADAFFAKCYRIQQDAREFLEAAPEFEDRLSDVAVSITTAKREMPALDSQSWWSPGDWFDGNPWEPMADTLTKLCQAEEAAAEGLPWVGRASAWVLGIADEQLTDFPGATTGDYGHDGDGSTPIGPNDLPEDQPGGNQTGGGQDGGGQDGGGGHYPGRPNAPGDLPKDDPGGGGGQGDGGQGYGGEGYGGQDHGGQDHGGQGDGDQGDGGGHPHYPGRPDVPVDLPKHDPGHGGDGGGADTDYPGRPNEPGGGAGGHDVPVGGGGTSGAGPTGGWPGAGGGAVVAGNLSGGMPGGVGALAAGAGALGLGVLGGKALGGALKAGAAPATSGLAVPPGAASGAAGSAAAVGGATSGGSGGGVAPMMPMGGMGGGGDGARSRRSSWLKEDAEVWGASDVAPGVLNSDTVA